MSDSTVRVVLVTAPPDISASLAHDIVEAGHAACVNIVPGLRSVYRWQGSVSDDPESLLMIKTHTDRLDALEDYLQGAHPYEVPAFVVLQAEVGAAYGAWMQAALTPPTR